MNKIDQILREYFAPKVEPYDKRKTKMRRMMTEILIHEMGIDKDLEKLKQALKQAILEGLPEKKEITHGVDMITIKNYNNALDDVTQSIERLFELSDREE